MKRTRIVERMIDEKWKSKRKFAEHIDIPPTTLQSILKRGVGNASIDNVIKICKGLGITVNQLEEMDFKDIDYLQPIINGAEINQMETNEYNYFEAYLSAGIESNVEPIMQGKKIILPDILVGKHAGNKDIYITRVNGDSMNKVIPHNSLIGVKPVELEELKDGDIVVYECDTEYAVKRFYRNGNNIIFKPDSTDIVFTDKVIATTQGIPLIINGKVLFYIVETE